MAWGGKREDEEQGGGPRVPEARAAGSIEGPA